MAPCDDQGAPLTVCEQGEVNSAHVSVREGCWDGWAGQWAGLQRGLCKGEGQGECHSSTGAQDEVFLRGVQGSEAE